MENQLSQVFLKFDMYNMDGSVPVIADVWEFRKVAERVMKAIKDLGDKGELKYDNTAGAIYWMIE